MGTNWCPRGSCRDGRKYSCTRNIAKSKLPDNPISGFGFEAGVLFCEANNSLDDLNWIVADSHCSRPVNHTLNQSGCDTCQSPTFLIHEYHDDVWGIFFDSLFLCHASFLIFFPTYQGSYWLHGFVQVSLDYCFCLYIVKYIFLLP